MASDFKITLGTQTGASGDFSVRDVRELSRRLKAIEPRLRTELVRDAKKVAKPLETDIKASIPSVAPLSGMAKDKGRLGWGNGVSPQKTLIQFRTGGSGGRSLTTSLVRVKVSSPGTVVADMAGRSGRYVGQGRKNDNATPTLKRRNASPAKGAAFIRNLNTALGHGASRMVWPAAEKSRDMVRVAIEGVLRNAYSKINQKGL